MPTTAIRRIVLRAFLGAALGVSAGCATYEPASQPQSRAYDRSWSAAIAAFNEEGVGVVKEDRAAGIIEARSGQLTVKASVQAQPDGKVRVEFTSSNPAQEPKLIGRLTQAYESRVGR